MEVTLVNKHNLEERCIVISVDATVGSVREEAIRVFAGEMEVVAGENVELTLQGSTLPATMDTEELRNCSIEAGCRIDVLPTFHSTYLAQLDAGATLKGMPSWIQGDPLCVNSAVRHSLPELQYATEELRSDKQIVKLLLTKFPAALEYLPAFQGDREMVLHAVKCDGKALEFASDEMKDCAEVVTSAMRRCQAAVGHASERLRCDKEFVRDAYRLSHVALQLAGDNVKQDRNFVLSLVEESHWGYASVIEELRGDRDIALACVTPDTARLLSLCPQILLADRDFIHAAIKKNPQAYQYASEGLRQEWGLIGSFCLAAVKSSFRVTS